MADRAGTEGRSPASFRDPSGFVFRRDGVIYRAVAQRYQPEYDRLMNSGLYSALCDAGLMVSHEEIETPADLGPDVYKTLRPRPVPFISYPYEWCFSQLRDAARLTLEIQKRALEFGMSLKDASGYNVQFIQGLPVFIDTLSFESYHESRPWVAYRQFCQHFLAPLALMSLRDVRLNQLLRTNVDGVPLDLAVRLLPGSSRLNLGLATHIHLHARSQKHYADKPLKPAGRGLSRMALNGLVASLESTVNGLDWQPAGTEWATYYDETNYSRAALDEKARLIGAFLDRVRPQTAWDLGANTGRFSRVAAGRGIMTLALDNDPAAVEQAYRDCRARGERNILPLLQDLTNPSPGLGWQNRERTGLFERAPADAVLALALVHHLAIGNNLPLDHVAEFMARVGRFVIVEFVPKEDSQVQRLLASREDIFSQYRREAFEAVFARRFEMLEREPVGDSLRTVYLMARRGSA